WLLSLLVPAQHPYATWRRQADVNRDSHPSESRFTWQPAGPRRNPTAPRSSSELGGLSEAELRTYSRANWGAYPRPNWGPIRGRISEHPRRRRFSIYRGVSTCQGPGRPGPA